MLKASFSDFHAFWKNDTDTFHVEGFVIDELGYKTFFNEDARKNKFVPHEPSYYNKILNVIDGYLQRSE